ncbi:MAG TPA: GntR family transcriptional regulator [Acidimicrobiales bacterium]|nr:GntR family transcriptional regulator [Acidimicrobiales bacterium]
MTPVDPSLLRAERPKKLAENVAAAILNYITSNRLEPGAPLPSEANLLRMFGVGRGSLREAVRILEIHGLLSIRSGRYGGPVVGAVTGDRFGASTGMYLHALGTTVQEVLEARLTLEPALAHAAALRVHVEPAISEYLEPFATENRRSRDQVAELPFVPTPSDFHWALAEGLGNGPLRLMSHAMSEVYSHTAKGVVFLPAEADAINRAHVDIAQAIVAGRADDANRTMRDHLVQVHSVLEDRYRELLPRRIPWP